MKPWIGRRAWQALAVAALVALTATVLWRYRSAPPIVTLPNGMKFQFVGTTYGTNHFAGPWSHLLEHLPKAAADYVLKHAPARLGLRMPYHTESPTLCVWFRPLFQVSPLISTSIMVTELADEQDLEAGTATTVWDISGARPFGEFTVLPRRSQILECSVYPPNGRTNYGSNDIARVKFANPLYGHFPQWQAGPLPVTNKADDLEVGLSHLATGFQDTKTPHFGPDGKQVQGYLPRNKGDGAPTDIYFWVITPQSTNRVWTLVSSELGDATGNVLRPRTLGWWPRDVLGNINPTQYSIPSGSAGSFPGTLWPDESAWRVRLGFKRISGFATNEVVTFRNVPIPALGTTNLSRITNVVGGRKIVLAEFAFRTNMAISASALTLPLPLNEIGFETSHSDTGEILDFKDMVTDTGETPKTAGTYQAPGNRLGVYLAYIPTNARTMDITIVVQKIRTVEFFVIPPVPQATSTNPP